MHRTRARLGWVAGLLVVAGLLAACGGAGAEPGADLEATAPANALIATPRSADSAALVAARPYRLVTPAGFDATKPAPLILVLHAYGSDATAIEEYFDLDPVASAHGALVAYPLGTLDSRDKRFWDATNVCCDFDRTGIDDVAYLGALIDDVATHYKVDARRIFVAGQSNGAFMAHRLACDLPDRIAAVVATSGANWAGSLLCQPSQPVAVLQVQGTEDPLVRYDGERLPFGLQLYVSALDSIARWADHNGCAANPTTAANLDLVAALEGTETTVERYSGCKANGAAELWTIEGGAHSVAFTPTFAETAWAFLDAHAKP